MESEKETGSLSALAARLCPGRARPFFDVEAKRDYIYRSLGAKKIKKVLSEPDLSSEVKVVHLIRLFASDTKGSDVSIGELAKSFGSAVAKEAVGAPASGQFHCWNHPVIAPQKQHRTYRTRPSGKLT